MIAADAREIILLAAKGWSPSKIARKRKITASNAKRSIAAIMGKLGVHDLAELARIAKYFDVLERQRAHLRAHPPAMITGRLVGTCVTWATDGHYLVLGHAEPFPFKD